MVTQRTSKKETEYLIILDKQQSKPINLKAKINKYGISVYVDKIK